MDDRDVERILRRYEPAGPREDLRARALMLRPAVRAWPWLAGAAALLAATIGFHAASHGPGGTAGMPSGEESGIRAALIAALGGDDLARARAEILLAAQDARRQAAPAPPDLPPQEAR